MALTAADTTAIEKMINTAVTAAVTKVTAAYEGADTSVSTFVLGATKTAITNAIAPLLTRLDSLETATSVDEAALAVLNGQFILD